MNLLPAWLLPVLPPSLRLDGADLLPAPVSTFTHLQIIQELNNSSARLEGTNRSFAPTWLTDYWLSSDLGFWTFASLFFCKWSVSSFVLCFISPASISGLWVQCWVPGFSGRGSLATGGTCSSSQLAAFGRQLQPSTSVGPLSLLQSGTWLESVSFSPGPGLTRPWKKAQVLAFGHPKYTHTIKVHQVVCCF